MELYKELSKYLQTHLKRKQNTHYYFMLVSFHPHFLDANRTITLTQGREGKKRILEDVSISLFDYVFPTHQLKTTLGCSTTKTNSPNSIIY